MKRPEGFDPAPPPEEGRPGRPQKPERLTARKTRAQKSRAQEPSAQEPGALESSAQEPSAQEPSAPKVRRESQERTTVDGSADHEAKKAARARRRYERGEVRRFTRRSRRRKITWLVTLIVAVLVGGAVTGAVYSPVLQLKTVRVEGASLVSAASVRDAVKNQIGTPLALVDFDAIRQSLSKYPLIRSFVTETEPPDTLVIRISERQPIGSLATSSGFSVVDPAGIVISHGAERAPGLPLIELGSAAKDSPAFTASVGVLLSLPADLLAKVDTVTAETSDDVTLALSDGKSVIWGSEEQSELKARVLAALVKSEGSSGAVSYDVSAPTHPVLKLG